MAPSTAAGASVARGYFAIIDKAPRHTLQMVSSSPISPRILANEQRDGKGDRRTHRRGQAAQTLFTQVPGSRILRTSPLRSSKKFARHRCSRDFFTALVYKEGRVIGRRLRWGGDLAMIAPGVLVLRLAVAAVLGALVGLERERLEWAAGMRTHAP